MTDGYFLNASKCLHFNQIAEGYGGDLNSGGIAACVIDHCKVCSQDCRRCERCKDAEGYIADGNICSFKVTRKVEVTISRFLPKSGQAEIRFSQEFTDAPIVQTPLKIKIIDLVQNKEFDCTVFKCEVVAVDENGFVLQFDSAVSIVRGEIHIEKTDSLSLIFKDEGVWLNYPIKVPEAVFISSEKPTQVASQTVGALNALRTPITAIIAFAAPAAASFMDTLMNILYMLKLIEGPGLSYPDNILDAKIDFQIIPYDIPNPFESWINNGNKCTPSDQFMKHGIDCYLLENEGVNYIEIPTLLILTLFVTYFSNWLLVKLAARKLFKMADTGLIKSNSRNTKSKVGQARLSNIEIVVQTLGATFGLQFFIVKMEGNQLQLIILSFLDLMHATSDSANILSATFCIITLLYYGVTTYFLMKNAMWIWNETRKLPVSTQSDTTKDLISDYLDLKMAPCPQFSYYFQDFKIPKRLWMICQPAASFAFTLCVCAVVTYLIDRPLVQSMLCTLLVAAIFFFELASNIRRSRLEQYSILSMYFLTVVYTLLKCFTVSQSIEESTRQFTLGIPMAAIVACLTVVGLLFAMTTMALMVYRAGKSAVAKCRRLKKKVIHSNLRDQEIQNGGTKRQVLPMVSTSEDRLVCSSKVDFVRNRNKNSNKLFFRKESRSKINDKVNKVYEIKSPLNNQAGKLQLSPRNLGYTSQLRIRQKVAVTRPTLTIFSINKIVKPVNAISNI